MVDSIQGVLSIMIANMKSICNRECADIVEFSSKQNYTLLLQVMRPGLMMNQEKFCGQYRNLCAK